MILLSAYPPSSTSIFPPKYSINSSDSWSSTSRCCTALSSNYKQKESGSIHTGSLSFLSCVHGKLEVSSVEAMYRVRIKPHIPKPRYQTVRRRELSFKCEHPNHPFESSKSKHIFFPPTFNLFPSFRTQSRKKRSAFRPGQLQWNNRKHFRNRIKKMWNDRIKIALGEKILEIENWQTSFCCLYVKLATVQIWDLGVKQ